MTPRGGVTLIELIVVIALLGVIAGIAGIAFHRARAVTGVERGTALVMAARDSALRSGRVVTIQLPVSASASASSKATGTATATAFPDGRVIADPGLKIDPLTGRGASAAR